MSNGRNGSVRSDPCCGRTEVVTVCGCLGGSVVRAVGALLGGGPARDGHGLLEELLDAAVAEAEQACSNGYVDAVTISITFRGWCIDEHLQVEEKPPERSRRR